MKNETKKVKASTKASKNPAKDAKSAHAANAAHAAHAANLEMGSDDASAILAASDPEEITRLSNCLQDVFFNDDAGDDSDGLEGTEGSAAVGFEKFSERLARSSSASAPVSAKAPGEEGKSDMSAAVSALRSRIAGGYDSRSLKGLLRSQVGMRVLIDVKTQLELRAYCTLLGVTEADVKTLVQGALDSAEGGSFANMPLLTAVGTWAQNVREEASRGEADAKASALAETAFATLGNVYSFKLGRNLSKRIWDGIDGKVARGRPRKDHADRLFI